MTLTWKIFLGTAAVVAAVLGGTLFLTNKSANEAADDVVGRGLTAATDQVRALLLAREEQLKRGAEIFVQPKTFLSLVMTKARENMLDQSTEAATRIGADWVQITDENGVRLAKSNDPSAPADTLAGSALIGGALEGRGVGGVGATGDTAIYQAVAVPIASVNEDGSAGPVIGVLMATKAIDSTLAQDVKRASAASGSDSTEVVIFALDRENKAHIAATTLPRSADLTAYVESRARAMLPDSGSGPAGSLTPAESIRAESLSRGGAGKVETTIGGTRFVGQGDLLRTASRTPLGGFLALRNRDAALGGFAALRQTILLSGAIGLVLAFLLSYVIAHQITRPVGALVVAAKRAADGDYAAEINVRSRDEIGTLATAFRALLGDLRDKQALVEVLSASGPGGDGKTVPMRQVTPTMQMAAGMANAVEPGQTFANRYEIKNVLGVGGMGMVYKAMDKELGEIVAIKTLKSDMMANDPSALERFKSEIRLARKISHRNVVRTHDLGENAGVYYITMEFVEGTSLKDLIRSRGRLPVPATLTVGKQLCRALEVAHEQGVIHRDIKPQNMVLEPGGVLKVMDFGIARLAQRGANEGQTQAGMVVGTPEYMAPEQLLGDNVDARVDIWASGVVLYECLTGTLPFVADNPITLITKLLETSPVPPRSVVADIPQPLSDLVMRTMSRDREARPRTALELHDLLAALD